MKTIVSLCVETKCSDIKFKYVLLSGVDFVGYLVKYPSVTVDPCSSLEYCLQENSTRILMLLGKSNIFYFNW